MDKIVTDMNRTQMPSTDMGPMKERTLADKIGDAVEGIGHKVSDMGMPSMGQKIHDLGDKLEKNHDDPGHPHDV